MHTQKPWTYIPVIFFNESEYHTGNQKIPPKKIVWGDIPSEEHVKEIDSDGKWIEYSVCTKVIREHAIFGFTE